MKPPRRQVHEPRVPAVAVVGVVADEDAVVLVQRHVEMVARAAGEDFQLRAVRPEADDAAAFEADVIAFLRAAQRPSATWTRTPLLLLARSSSGMPLSPIET